MPELPEVEIVRQSLNKSITGEIIKDVLIKNRNLRFKIPKNFEKNILKKKIIKVDRFSKHLILKFEDSSNLMIHLGMSGTIHLVNNYRKKNLLTNTSFYHSPLLPKKHNHVEMKIGKFKLIYNDPRRFGYFSYFINNKKLNNKFKKYGPEPFSKYFNQKYIYNFFKNKKKNIKNFLIDQSFVSGIGNIYASEILFLCKILPSKEVGRLSFNNCQKISYFSRKVLKKAIEKGGSSIRDFKNVSGDQGSFQKNFNVYQRENKKCLKYSCKGTIIKKIISNRSSFFCNLCQK
ncbi:bifunctional DNA-formamidopyrimidine glycosylase/DNA-(apurinic or apyrimidinic site) lyase [Pelagibacterales bacterium SAG-MED23]|nr:bifunctional DNA-formamidopyrimidine glycosylase/DNA-(apurinic or apyrimidinic site) lyase [Pelagibacterales bacterium SAG-MED23]